MHGRRTVSTTHGAFERLVYARVWMAIGWALVALVVYLSLTPSMPSVNTGWDKTDHLLGYGVLMFWFRQAFAPRVVWIVFLILLGVAMEALQAQTSYRQPEVADMLANTMGVCIGFGLAVFTPLGSVVRRVDGVLASWLAR